MKLKVFVVLQFIFYTFSMFGQLNPVSNLIYQQTHVLNSFCPQFNCFELSWEQPISSNDTLIGYNVYRDNDFWIFTENNIISCSEMIPCEYNDFYETPNNPNPFWIKIKAVYNVDSLLSESVDSIQTSGLMTEIDDYENQTIQLMKNPISKNENIVLIFNSYEGEECKIKIYSENGVLIKEYSIDYLMNGITSFSTKGLSSGVYIINILIGKEIVTEKIILL